MPVIGTCCYEKFHNCTASSATVTTSNGDYLERIDPKLSANRVAHFKCFDQMSKVALDTSYSSYLEPVAAIKGAIDSARYGKGQDKMKGHLYEKGYMFGIGFNGGDVGDSKAGQRGQMAGKAVAMAIRKFMGPKGQLIANVMQQAQPIIDTSRALTGGPTPKLLTDGHTPVRSTPFSSTEPPKINTVIPGTNRFVIDVSQAFRDSKGYYLKDANSGSSVSVYQSSQGYFYVNV